MSKNRNQVPYPGKQIPGQQPNAIRVQQQEIFAGPLPHPEILQKYESIEKGFANRIITMAENQSSHRQSMEKKDLLSDITLSYFGLCSATIISLLFGVLSFLAIIYGHAIAGSVLGGTTMVSLVTVFISGSKKKKPNK